MRSWLYKKSMIIFWATLSVYILIWATVSYVGVYVTYVAGPVLLVSGITMWFSAPKSGD